jgi:nicotinate-nucleotide adenylyltransferase
LIPSQREARGLAHVRRLGAYGGTFDPVHAGHLHVAREAQRAFELDQVVFVPASRSPFKPEGATASPGDRLAMLEIALAGEPSWSISTLELERRGPSYTHETLVELPVRVGLRPGAQLFLLLGWDNLRGLERWHRARELLRLAQPVVVGRGDEDPGLLAHLARELGPELYARLERGFVRGPTAPESATELRELLARGEDPGAALPPGVLEYIRARGIYAPGSRGRG